MIRKQKPWVVPVEQLEDIDDEIPYLLKVFTRKKYTEVSCRSLIVI